jgi:hypothetical protein
MAKRKPDPWKRCWRGNVPRRQRLLIYDSNERLSLVDSRKDRFFEHWQEKTGGKIKFFIEVEPLPFETYQLWAPDFEPAKRLGIFDKNDTDDLSLRRGLISSTWATHLNRM